MISDPENALRCVFEDLGDEVLALTQVMAWCCQVNMHYLIQFDPYLWHHMVLLRHNELIVTTNKQQTSFCHIYDINSL